MIILESYKDSNPSSSHFSTSDVKMKFYRTKAVRCKLIGNSTTIALSLSLAGCNNSAVTIIPCAEGGSDAGYICVDSEASSGLANIPGEAIAMPNQQVPVLGTVGSDNFVATSGFLTSKTFFFTIIIITFC